MASTGDATSSSMNVSADPVEVLLNFIDISERPSHKRGILLASNVTNNTICMLRGQRGSDAECVDDLLFLLNSDEDIESLNLGSIRKKINDTYKQYKSLKTKRNKIKTAAFLGASFLLPHHRRTPDVSKSRKRKAETTFDVSSEVQKLKEEILTKDIRLEHVILALEEVQQEHKVELDSVKDSNTSLINKMKTTSDKFIHVSKVSKTLVETVAKQKQVMSKYSTRNINKRVRHRDEKLRALQDQNELLRLENETLTTELHDSTTQQEIYRHKIDGLKSEKISLQKKLSSLKIRVKTVIGQQSEEVDNVERLEATNKRQSREIKELEELVSFLEDQSAPKYISTFCNGRYNNTIREVCIKMLAECNVSLKKLPVIIETVLNKLAGISIDRLPAPSTLSLMFAEASVIASTQVASAMLKDFNASAPRGAVLHQDATTKYHKHYEGMQITLKGGESYSLGLRQVAGGDAQTYKDAFDEIFHDLSHAIKDGNDNEKTARLVTSIKAFMNDRCAVNSVFTHLVESHRNALIPAVVSNFDNMSTEQRQEILEMGFYACRMHLLANFAPAADKGLRKYEECTTEGENPHAFKNDDSSGTLRLIRTAAKAFTERGSDKSGVNSYFESFLTEKNKMITFNGHRFNIMFYDGAAVYYHHKDISKFLDNWPNPNKLLASIKFDIKEPVYIAGIRALGIISKLVTEPFQKIVSKNGPILELTPILHQMQLCLQNWSKDGSEPLSGATVFTDVVDKQSDVFKYLFNDTEDAELDSLTILALELISGDMLILLERQAESQLPGGKMFSPTCSQQSISSNVPCSNIISERDMAILDNISKQKPSASVSTIEACLMWQVNKPSCWLDSMTDAEKDEIFNHAQASGPSLRELIKSRKLILKEKLFEKLISKQQEKAKQEQKTVNLKTNAVRDLEGVGGLWQLEDMPHRLDQFESEKDMRKALIQQIKFYKIVLQVKAPRHIFQESSGGKIYSIETLKENLKHLISNSVEPQEKSAGLFYKEKEVYLDEATEKKQATFKILLEARKKRLSKNQIKFDLPSLLAHPENLVGRDVFHKCEENSTIDWFEGNVTRIFKATKNAIQTVYSITYEESQDDEWTFPLLLDLKKGDLVIKNYP